MKIKIYSGLSLNKNEILKYLPTAEVSPPVKRNDLLQDIKNNVHVVGIIDGEFLQNLSISPSEIMDALRCGMKVYGASSMGAMRAVELAPHGMRGVGRIFEHIQKTDYFPDDHLGQIYYESSNIISMPYVDFYFASLDLVQAKQISPAAQKNLCHHYSKMHFSERTLGNLASLLRSIAANKKDLHRALEIIAKKKYSVKKQDALLLLKKINDDLKMTKKWMTQQG